MFQLLKVVPAFIWQKRKFLIYLLLLSSLIFVLRFPWSRLMEKTIRSLQKKSPPHLQTDFESLAFLLWPPGLDFKGFSLSYRKKNIQVESLKVSPILSRFIAFKPVWSFKAFEGKSSLALRFWKEQRESKENPEEPPTDVFFVKAYSPSLELELLNSFFSHTKMSGNVLFRSEYEGNLGGEMGGLDQTKASINLKGKDLQLSQMELNMPIGQLSFPLINWSTGELSLSLKEGGELELKNIHLGGPKDSFILKMRGTASLSLSYGRLRLNSYNIQLQMDVDKDFKISLLNLMFAGYKEDKGHFDRYQLRLLGRGKQLPTIEKLPKF